MSEVLSIHEKIFDELYIYFSDMYLTAERNNKECDIIERLCKLKVGDRILDVGCGHGRIANELARRGYCVIGIDWNHSAIELARKNAKKSNLVIDYEQKDFLDSCWSQKFDCVLSWYTSFGFVSDEDCRQQLAKINQVLKPKGRFLIDHINRELCLKKLPDVSVQEREKNFMIDSYQYDINSGYLHVNRRFIKEGKVINAPYRMRLFSFTELKGWLNDAGFKRIEGFDSCGGTLVIDSNRMIVVGVK